MNSSLTALHWLYEQNRSTEIGEKTFRDVTKKWLSDNTNASTSAWNRSDADLHEMRVLVDKHRNLLEELEDVPAARPPSAKELAKLLFSDARNPLGIRQPDVWFSKFLADLTALDIEIAVADGDLDRAAGNINRIFDLGIAISDVPTLISCTIGSAINVSGYNCLEGLLEMHVLSSQQLVSISKKIESHDHHLCTAVLCLERDYLGCLHTRVLNQRISKLPNHCLFMLKSIVAIRI